MMSMKKAARDTFVLLLFAQLLRGTFSETSCNASQETQILTNEADDNIELDPLVLWPEEVEATLYQVHEAENITESEKSGFYGFRQGRRRTHAKSYGTGQEADQTYASGPSGQIIDLWNNVVRAAIAANSLPPTKATRALAIVHLAIFDAINSITRIYENYAAEIVTRGYESLEAAASMAAYDALIFLFPNLKPLFEKTLKDALHRIPDKSSIDRGMKVGNIAAAMIIYLRKNDGADQEIPYDSDVHIPGVWRRTPRKGPYGTDLPGEDATDPHWPFVKPFVLERGDMFRPRYPSSLDIRNREFVRLMKKTKLLGEENSNLRTAEDEEKVLFWDDPSGTPNIAGHLNLVAQQLSQHMEITEKAYLFALLNVAMADGTIVCWDSKYALRIWRPITAIRSGLFEIYDPFFQSFLETPPHPTYLSGHTVISGVFEEIMRQFFGRDNIPFLLPAQVPGLPPRHFNGFAHASKENAVSRIYGGIHFESDVVDSRRIGIEVGRYVADHFLKRIQEYTSTKQLY